jgi:hypothetical protein
MDSRPDEWPAVAANPNRRANFWLTSSVICGVLAALVWVGLLQGGGVGASAIFALLLCGVPVCGFKAAFTGRGGRAVAGVLLGVAGLLLIALTALALWMLSGLGG